MNIFFSFIVYLHQSSNCAKCQHVKFVLPTFMYIIHMYSHHDNDKIIMRVITNIDDQSHYDLFIIMMQSKCRVSADKVLIFRRGFVISTKRQNNLKNLCPNSVIPIPPPPPPSITIYHQTFLRVAASIRPDSHLFISTMILVLQDKILMSEYL